VFAKVLHWYLSWARSIQSIPSHPISLRSILILSPSYALAFPVVSFLLAFSLIFYMLLSSSHSCYMPFPPHSPWGNTTTIQYTILFYTILYYILKMDSIRSFETSVYTRSTRFHRRENLRSY
jgi:hypothetical protein